MLKEELQQPLTFHLFLSLSRAFHSNAPTTEKENFNNVNECLEKIFNQKGLNEYDDDLNQVLLLVAKNQLIDRN